MRSNQERARNHHALESDEAHMRQLARDRARRMQHLAFETAVEMKSHAPLDAQLKTMTWHVLLEMAGGDRRS